MFRPRVRVKNRVRARVSSRVKVRIRVRVRIRISVRIKRITVSAFAFYHSNICIRILPVATGDCSYSLATWCH